MASTPARTCREPTRRRDIRSRGSNGIDYVEVSGDRRTLTAVFLNRIAIPVTPANVVVEGGTRVRDIKVLDVRLRDPDAPDGDIALDVAIDRPGDMSGYTLRLVALDGDGRPTGEPLSGIDPRYAAAPFRFAFGEATDRDCRPPEDLTRPVLPEPEINYLARDYQSFRQLILDRLAVTLPGWQEQHVPDTGIAVVEVLAFVADRLSYYQDAVACEAYLATARQRISVKRHVRLVGYPMHEGCNARAWIVVGTAHDAEIDPATTWFVAGYRGPARGASLSPDDLSPEMRDGIVVFEPLARQRLHAAHNAIAFHAWGDRGCVLPAGATSATLRDGPGRRAGDRPDAEAHASPRAKRAGRAGSALSAGERTARAPAEPADDAGVHERFLRLGPGDRLLLEETEGPDGTPPDPRHRHVVTLTEVRHAFDALYDQPIVEVAWAAEDALPFALRLSDDGATREASVARGNVVLADHGDWTAEGARVSERLPAPVRGRRFRPVLRTGPLLFHDPRPGPGAAAGTLRRDPRTAVPQLLLTSIPTDADNTPLFTFADLDDPSRTAARLAAPTDAVSRRLKDRLPDPPPGEGTSGARHANGTDTLRAQLGALLRTWTPQRDLLASGADDLHFVVEMDEAGLAHLRFGDGRNGRAPEPGEQFRATYRVGVGPAGNVGAETITHVLTARRDLALTPRNPLPAAGGTAPEPVAAVKLLAPKAGQGEIGRAVRAEDYARLAGRNPRVQRAACELRWAGTRWEAHVAVDPLGTEAVDEGLLREVRADLDRVRRIGHDVVVVPATYVPVDVAVQVLVRAGSERGHIETRLRDIFSDRRLADGRLGVFHPDNLTFGGSIHVSRLVAAGQGVDGVESVVVSRLQRRFAGPDRELDEGVLRIGPLEVARLGSNRASAEDGRFALTVRGGR